MVSLSQGRVLASSAKPPQRSTTVSPSRVAQHEAPTSAPLAKFASKASRTELNLSATKPWTVLSGIRLSLLSLLSQAPKTCQVKSPAGVQRARESPASPLAFSFCESEGDP